MNSVKKMKPSEKTKYLMVHADDAGLSHSENRATISALENGFVNSYSIMVPCPWFYEMAIFAKNNPQFDNGIHLTLTCEWETYKFGPVLPISEVPSLVDANGHFYKNRADVGKYASPEDVRTELRAQIDKALQFGLEPSHIDSHMYSVGANPAFLKIYKELGKKYKLPVFINEQVIQMIGLDPKLNIEEEDLVVAHAYVGDYKDFEKGKLSEYYSGVLDNLSFGLNIILIHPAFDDDEMKGVTFNHPNFGSEWRQIDFDFFTSEENRLKLSENNIELVTWRDIKSGRVQMHSYGHG